MKKRIFYLCMFLFVGSGCQDQQTDELINECIGVSFNYLDNQSSDTLFVSFKGPFLNDQIDTAAAIRPQQRVLIGQDASFGSIPRPAETFSGFALYAIIKEKRQLVYQQNPVQNELWVKQKQNPADPDYGCQVVDYTLIVTDDLIIK